MNESNPISLNEALTKSDYPGNTKDKIKLFVFENYKHYKNNSFLYLTKCFNKNIFVIKFNISVLFKNNNYTLTLLIYIPITFPNNLRIYFENNQNFHIHQYYQDNKIIDYTTAELYYEQIIDFIPLKKPITILINALKDKFNANFPLFKSSDTNELYGPCSLDLKNSFKIEIKEDDLKDSNELINMRKKIKDKIFQLLDNKLLEIQQTESQLEDLKIRINSKLENFQKKNTNNELEEMNVKLVELISKLEFDIESLKYKEYKSPLEKCEEVVRIKDEKIFKYKVIEKNLDLFISYLKKAYEKKIISYNKCVEEIRKVSKELFFVKYCIEKRNKLK